MDKYEITIIIDDKATSASKKSMGKKIADIVDGLKGKVLKTDDWGKKEFAYKLRGKESGVYLHFELELNSAKIADFKSALRLEDKIISYLLIKSN